MSAGAITTARGLRLNIGELKMRQKKPLSSNVDAKDTIQRSQRPVKQANVVGYVPSMAGVLKPASPVIVVQESSDYTPSIADFTGVVLDNSDGRIDAPGDAANDALDSIIGDLEQMRKSDNKSDVKSRRK